MTASDETIQALVIRSVSLQRGDLYAEAERAYRGALAVDENYALAQTTGHDSLDTRHHCGTTPTRGAGRHRRVSDRR